MSSSLRSCLFAMIDAAIMLVCSSAIAVDPPPDGGYPNGNTAEGEDALFSLTTGLYNTAVGFDSLFADTTGGLNTALGYKALAADTTGFANTAVGFVALSADTTGSFNTGVGIDALQINTTGQFNTAVGEAAMALNVTGSYNTGVGTGALISGAAATFNTGVGYNTLGSNIDGSYNTVVGAAALTRNTHGERNTVAGFEALNQNETGSNNAAYGNRAMLLNINGRNNTAVGATALHDNTIGSNNIVVGNAAGSNLTTGDYNICIGNRGVAAEGNTIRIGTTRFQANTYISGIAGVTVPNGVPVVVDTDGHLGILTSSKRFKQNIEPMNDESNVIFSLQPVRFRYKASVDQQKIQQFGLIAEDVSDVDPDLVANDEQGRPYTVRYEAINAMLLNEFLKEHARVAEQGKEIAQLKAAIARLEKAVTHNQQ